MPPPRRCGNVSAKVGHGRLPEEFLKGITAGLLSGLAGKGAEAAGGEEISNPCGFENFEPAYLKLDRRGELGKREKLLWDILKECKLCPRLCKVKRLAGESKVCRSDHRLKVHSASAHFGEERPLVGSDGSGTIFFSNCNLLCCFCQNWEIAHRGDGGVISHKQQARAWASEAGLSNLAS